jgi:mannosylglucosylglycerate synthase
VSVAVGLVHFTAPPIVGGVESVLGHHARLLADAGHEVRVVVGRGGPLDPRLGLTRVPLANAAHPAIRAVQHALDGGTVPPTFEPLVTQLAEDLRQALAGLDVVVAHNVCSLNINVPLTAALYRLVETGSLPPLVAWDHDVAATADQYRERLHDGYPWDLFVRPWPGTVSVTISEKRRQDLAGAIGIPPSSIHVVPNGIDRATFLGLSATTRRLMDLLGLHDCGPLLLAPTRVTPRKNLELAIDVLAELRHDADDVRLIITGAPDVHDPEARRYLAALRAYAESTGAGAGIHLLADGPPAWRSARVVAELFRVADALFLPSRDEGFGLPILEAGAARLPVICADIPALRELAQGDATYVDPSGDPAVAAGLVRERLARDPAYRLAARTRATFSWSTLYATRIEPLILGSAARPRR